MVSSWRCGALLSVATACADATHDEKATDGTGTPGDNDEVAVCGNGIVEAGEHCDLGFANRDGGPCRLDCTVAGCGDGRLDDDEACDEGEGGGLSCTSLCTSKLDERWRTDLAGLTISDMIVAGDGNIVLTGYGSGPDGHSTLSAVRAYAPNGRFLWGRIELVAFLSGVAIDRQGNIVAVGTTTDRAYVVTLDSMGDRLWTFTDDAAGRSTFGDVVVDAAGKVQAVGYRQTGGQSTADAIVVELSSEGSVVRDRTYSGEGGHFDSWWRIALAENGERIVGGTTWPTGEFPPDSRARLARLDAAGEMLWDIELAGTAGVYDDISQILVDGAARIFVTGSLLLEEVVIEGLHTGKTALVLMELADDGTVLWESAHGDLRGPVGYRFANSLVESPSGWLAMAASMPIDGPGCGTTSQCPQAGFLFGSSKTGDELLELDDHGWGESSFPALAFDPAGDLYLVGAGNHGGLSETTLRRYQVLEVMP